MYILVCACFILNKESKSLNTKGPRVKHVCRSAESVLGQTPATFGSILEKTEDDDNLCKY